MLCQGGTKQASRSHTPRYTPRHPCPPSPLAGPDQQPEFFCGFLLMPFQVVLSCLGSLRGPPFPPVFPTPQLFCPTSVASEPTAARAEGPWLKTRQRGDSGPPAGQCQRPFGAPSGGPAGSAPQSCLWRGGSLGHPWGLPSGPSEPPGCPPQGRPGFPGSCGYR